MINYSLVLALLLACCPTKDAISQTPPDMHECGSFGSPTYPPHVARVQLFFDQFGNDRPTYFSVLLIDKNGTGSFSNSLSKQKVDILKAWAKAKKWKNTFYFWGEYNAERHDSERRPYEIKLDFKKGILTSFKIIGYGTASNPR